MDVIIKLVETFREFYRSYSHSLTTSGIPSEQEKKAELENHLANLKLIIIDEISLVSSQILHNINKRLSQIEIIIVFLHIIIQKI